MKMYYFLLLQFIFIHSSEAIMTETLKPKIIIIGAGLAGLTTAYRLDQAGYDVEVYEARNRLGGRVFSALLNGDVIELGGHNLLDGGETSHILSLVEELGLEVEEAIFPLNMRVFDGIQIVDSASRFKEYGYTKETLKICLDEICQKSTNMQQVIDQFFDNDELLRKVFSVRLAAYEGGTPETLSLHNIFTFYHMLLGGLSYAHQACEGEENILKYKGVVNGNGRILDKINQLLRKSVHVSCPLVKLEKDEQGYSLTFATGEIKNADIVVLAIPASVLEDLEIVEEVISSERLELMKAVKYGTTAKILVPRASYCPLEGFTNGRLISYYSGKNDNVTLFYTFNHGAFDQNSINDTLKEDYFFLSQVYRFEPEKLKVVIAKDEDFASYTQAVGHSWLCDPYAKGSYSYFAAGQESWCMQTEEHFGERVRSVFAPIEDTLYFAGEHTTVLFEVGGTMEAAVESGERIARMIKRKIHFN